MAPEWQTATLDSLVDKVLDRRGITVRKLGSNFVPAGHRVISAKLIKFGRIDMAADEPRFVDDPTYARWMETPLLPDDVLLTSEAPLGEVAYVSESLEWCLGQRLFAIRTNKRRLMGRFLYYALQSDAVRHDLHSRATGTTVEGIRQSELRRVQIPVPPVDAQRAIAYILGTLDDKVELNRRMNETLEASAWALFKSWFVDFEPVRAKSERRESGLPPFIDDLFPDSFGQSELSAIPLGWSLQPFSTTVEIFGGGTPATSIAKYWGGDIPWFSVADAPAESDVWVVSTEKKITREGLDKSPTRLLPIGTTIITARGTVGRVALVGVPMALNQSCYGIVDQVGQYGYFAYFAVRNLVVSLQRHAHGSVFDTITRDTLAGVSVVVPPSSLIAAFEDVIHPTMERLRVSLMESTTVAALRDTLLPKLMSGELRVDDVVPRLREPA